MIIGFTGTREGMTDAQKLTVRRIMQGQTDVSLCAHGDCVGADADFDAICKEIGFETAALPCYLERLRAHCTKAITQPRDPDIRNRDIVELADKMIACPKGFAEENRHSGTWNTIRMARRSMKKLAIIFPDGKVEVFDEGEL